MNIVYQTLRCAELRDVVHLGESIFGMLVVERKMKMKTNIQKYVHTALLANSIPNGDAQPFRVPLWEDTPSPTGMKVNIHKDQGSAQR